MLRPTLYVGVGTFGRHALLELRTRLPDRFGDLAALPALRILYLDSDPEAKTVGAAGSPDRALAPEQVFPTPLHPVTRYRRAALAQITDELNVSSLASLSEVGGSLVDTTAKANFRALGKRFGKRVQEVAKAVAAADAAALSLALREGTASVEVEGETVTLAPDEVIITETPREGWSVASEPLYESSPATLRRMAGPF